MGSSQYLRSTKNKVYFGDKLTGGYKNHQKIIQMKKNVRKIEIEKTIPISSDKNVGFKDHKSFKDIKSVKKSKYLKIRGAGSEMSKSKVSTKSAKGYLTDKTTNGSYSSLQKLRRGSTTSNYTINSGRQSTIKDKKTASSLSNTMKSSSLRKSKNKENRSPNGQRSKAEPTTLKVFGKSTPGAKTNLKSSMNRKFFHESSTGNRKSNASLKQKEYTNSFLSSSDAGSLGRGKTTLGSMKSLSSAGTVSIKS